MTPEGKVKAKLKALLQEWGAYYFMPVQTGYGAAGVDFFVCANSRFIAIETKRLGEKTPTKRQKLVLDAVLKAGGDAFVVTLNEKGDLEWWQWNGSHR